MSSDEIEVLIDEKMERSRDAVIGAEAQIMSNGFLDTTKGMTLTSDAAIHLVRKNAETYALKRQVSEKSVDRRAIAEEMGADKLQKELGNLKQITTLNSAQLSKMSIAAFSAQTRLTRQNRELACPRALERCIFIPAISESTSGYEY